MRDGVIVVCVCVYWILVLFSGCGVFKVKPLTYPYEFANFYLTRVDKGNAETYFLNIKGIWQIVKFFECLHFKVFVHGMQYCDKRV